MDAAAFHNNPSPFVFGSFLFKAAVVLWQKNETVLCAVRARFLLPRWRKTPSNFQPHPYVTKRYFFIFHRKKESKNTVVFWNDHMYKNDRSLLKRSFARVSSKRFLDARPCAWHLTTILDRQHGNDVRTGGEVTSKRVQKTKQHSRPAVTVQRRWTSSCNLLKERR